MHLMLRKCSRVDVSCMHCTKHAVNMQQNLGNIYKYIQIKHGSAWGPVTLPVFKTGGRRLSAAMVGSTPTRFRHILSLGFNRQVSIATEAANTYTASACGYNQSGVRATIEARSKVQKLTVIILYGSGRWLAREAVGGLSGSSRITPTLLPI